MPSKFCKVMFVTDQEYLRLREDVHRKGALLLEFGLPLTYRKYLGIDLPRQLLLRWIECFDHCAEVYRPDDQYVDITSGCFRSPGGGAKNESHIDIIGQGRQCFSHNIGKSGSLSE